MEPAGIAAGGITRASPRFGSKCATGARTPIVDCTTDIYPTNARQRVGLSPVQRMRTPQLLIDSVSAVGTQPPGSQSSS